jgi:hypothetical protein
MGPDQRIADYISANRRKLTREAITQQLLEAGYEQAAIDATWAVLDTPDPDDRVGEGFWGRFFLILIGINVAVVVLVGLSTGAFAADRIGLLGILLIALAIGALISWGIVAAVGPTRLGRTTATVIGIVIPLVFALLIGGSCYALLASLGPPPRSGTMQLQVEARDDLSGSGSATCFVRSGSGFSVFGQREGQPYVSTSITGNPPDGGTQVQDLSISVEPTSETDRGESWSTYAPGGGETIEADVGREGLEGTVTFTDLPSDLAGPEFEGQETEPISGSVTWSCD